LGRRPRRGARARVSRASTADRNISIFSSASDEGTITLRLWCHRDRAKLTSGGLRQRKPQAILGRRELLRTLGGGAVLAAAFAGEVPALPPSFPDRRKARYQANSPEVQEFHRVNRYTAK